MNFAYAFTSKVPRSPRHAPTQHELILAASKCLRWTQRKASDVFGYVCVGGGNSIGIMKSKKNVGEMEEMSAIMSHKIRNSWKLSIMLLLQH